jgi:hypothetical protein
MVPAGAHAELESCNPREQYDEQQRAPDFHGCLSLPKSLGPPVSIGGAIKLTWRPRRAIKVLALRIANVADCLWQHRFVTAVVRPMTLPRDPVDAVWQ